MGTATKENLVASTVQFFERHWGIESAWPTWDFSWKWRGPVPNYRLGGVYALFVGNDLLYVGLGASRGAGNYQDCGISRRLMAHVIRTTSDDSGGMWYTPRDHWLSLGVDLVATIGFRSECSYLAPALEDYLIGKLNPPENSVKRNLSGAGVPSQ